VNLYVDSGDNYGGGVYFFKNADKSRLMVVETVDNHKH